MTNTIQSTNRLLYKVSAPAIFMWAMIFQCIFQDENECLYEYVNQSLEYTSYVVLINSPVLSKQFDYIVQNMLMVVSWYEI